MNANMAGRGLTSDGKYSWHVCANEGRTSFVLHIYIDEPQNLFDYMLTLPWFAPGLVRKVSWLEAALLATHSSTAAKHAHHARTTADLKTEQSKLNLSQRQLRRHHQRTASRHRTVKGDLSTLERKQAKDKRQRAALKKHIKRTKARHEQQLAQMQQVTLFACLLMRVVMPFALLAVCSCHVAPSSIAPWYVPLALYSSCLLGHPPIFLLLLLSVRPILLGIR